MSLLLCDCLRSHVLCEGPPHDKSRIFRSAPSMLFPAIFFFRPFLLGKTPRTKLAGVPTVLLGPCAMFFEPFPSSFLRCFFLLRLQWVSGAEPWVSSNLSLADSFLRILIGDPHFLRPFLFLLDSPSPGGLTPKIKKIFFRSMGGCPLMTMQTLFPPLPPFPLSRKSDPQFVVNWSGRTRYSLTPHGSLSGRSRTSPPVPPPPPRFSFAFCAGCRTYRQAAAACGSFFSLSLFRGFFLFPPPTFPSLYLRALTHAPRIRFCDG